MSDLEEQMAWQIKAVGLPEPEREYRFHHSRRWRFDFAWPERKVTLEVDGGHWVRGRHTRGAGFEADAEKYNAATVHGWRVLRVTSTMIEDGRAINWLERLLVEREGR